MQGVSSYISCMKLINVIIISKTGFKEFSLFKSLIFAWNSSSTQQLVWLHSFSTSRHAIPRFVHIYSSTFLFQTITSILLLCIQTLVILLCSLLDKLSNAYPHASFWTRVWKPHHFKMMIFINFRQNTQLYFYLNANFNHLESSSFSALKLLKNPMKNSMTH